MTRSIKSATGLVFTLVALLGANALAQPMTAILRFKERVPLNQLAQNVQSTVSTRYRQFYSPAEIKSLVAPTDQDYSLFLLQLRDEGFTITSETPSHLWVGVSGDSTLFNQVFSSNVKPVSTPESGLHQNLSLASIPSRLSLVETVVGLDNTRKSHPNFVKASALLAEPGGIPQATIKGDYGFNALYTEGLSGKGQDIAVATYDGFNIDDVTSFYSLSSLKPGPQVDQVNFNGVAAYNEDSATETELDAEFSGMMAPGASIHVFPSFTNDDTGELQLFTAILDDNRSKIVNYSWGDCEANLASSHEQDMMTVFARAMAQGVNIMVASGDSGSDGCQNNTIDAGWPATAPYVVAVGGTTFAEKNGELAETAWTGSGGGISTLFSLPAWQSGLPATYAKRSIPDVAFNADPNSGEAIYTHQNGKVGWLVIGGTSMAAPQWSGFMALVGENRANLGKATVGYLNPLIYGLSSAQRAETFHDITSGSNGAYSAQVGWDAVTGWGSMQATSLLGILSL